MNNSGHIVLIDRLRALPRETEWLEFKGNYYEPHLLGEYLSALANAACLSGQPRGYLIFGIDNETHEVIGTGFDPYAVKGKGNQDLLPWLVSGLRPNTGFETRIVEHPGGRVVLFDVGPAHDQPVNFYGTADQHRYDDRRAVRTITADNGTEFHDYARIEDALGARFYFATPHHAWERGTNENTNGLIRQYVPKGTSMAHLSAADCAAITAALNTRPRKRLHYNTPQECFDAC